MQLPGKALNPGRGCCFRARIKVFVQESHLRAQPGLRVDQRSVIAAELEPTREIGGNQHTTASGSKVVHMVESRLSYTRSR